MRGLKGKVFIVAGGAAGIAQATALRLVEEGAKVVIGDINGAGAMAMAERLTSMGGEALGAAFDLADDATCAALAKSAQDRFGAVHGLFNCGFESANHDDLDLLSTSEERIAQLWNVNAMGYARTIRHTLPLILASGGGSIVNMSSTAVTAGEPVRVAYAMAKGSVEALTRHVASRWGKENVRCNTINSGIVLTEKLKEFLTPEFEAMLNGAIRVPQLEGPDALAAAAVFLLSEESRYTNGKQFFFDGGWGLM